VSYRLPGPGAPSNMPDRFSRRNRFQMLFHLPNHSGSARPVMLWTMK
jgi:hypothetical protein